MQSFRAEGYGHLAGLSYLKRYIEYYGISVHPKCRIKVFCDNEMLLKRLIELRNLPEHQKYASHYVGADIDVLLTILQLDLPFRYGSDHVKGHQDDHAMADELTREAQLNVRADQLATAALVTQLGSDKPAAYLPLPGCNAFLIHRSTYITSRLKQTLQNEIPEKEFRQCVRGRFKWDQDAFDSVDWTAFSQAYRKLTPDMKVFVTKLLFRWLPVGTRMQRQKEWSSNQCYLCSLPETVEHLHQCPQRRTWQTEFTTALDKFLCQECTEPSLRADIVQGVTAWLTQDDLPFELETGWDTVLRGYVVHRWTTEQERYYRAHGFDAKKKTGIGWAVKLTTFFWFRTHNLWKQRCNDIHDRDQKEKLSREHQEAITKTRAIYSRRNDMLHSDQVLLDMSLEDRLRRPARSLMAWVRSTMPVVKISVREKSELMRQGCRDIRDFFIRQPIELRPPPDPDP